MIRYEDLSIDPFGTSDELFKFLDLSSNTLVDKFIEEHTQTARKLKLTAKANKIDTTSKSETLTQDKDISYGRYTTFRNSKSAAFSWKKKMNREYILKVQSICKKPMHMLGYNPMTNIDKNIKDDDFPLIVKSSHDLWSTDL